MTEPEPLTVAEVAARWRVSPWTVAAMTRDGRLAKIPGLGRIRIPVAAVEAAEGYRIPDTAQAPHEPSFRCVKGWVLMGERESLCPWMVATMVAK